MKMMARILVLIVLMSCVSTEHQGRVVKVVDGDTFDMLQGNETARIRLFGIDSPERGQAFNKKAKEFTVALVAGKDVKVIVHNKDRYGRSVADVYLADGTHVNAEIVKAGYAWHFKRYSDNTTLAALEKEARDARRGLWEDVHPIPPWEYRKR